MNLQQIQYIVALDKFKNFSHAAESCFITQATLSTMVKKLEEELDIVIFDRKTNPILTTECGKELIEEAKKILWHSNNLKQLSSTLKGNIEGELRIGVIPTIAGNLLYRVIPDLILKFPKLKLFISEINTSSIIQKIKMGELDAGIVSTPLNVDGIDEEILYYEKLLVYGNQNRNKKYLIPEEISTEKIWLLEEGNCLREQVINFCGLNPKKMHENLHFQPNSFETLLSFVDRLNGLTLIPELYFMDLPLEKKSKVIDFQTPVPVREVSVIYHRPYAKLRLVNTLIKEIKETILPLLSTSTLKNNEIVIAKI
ncbi:LysR substrate-binding domain-containing protein [Arundinibacter roseus]|uniref:LysR family transcriptional regulator n=1 Tax=Arundinibacter roseus TaxID=2070510 RepID=A0A4R4KKV5_9BACT|nr:LysR substrate-binding domain-containing protein [Arundinibacter roseus]TDB68828.1 LysR family transcriptional regulator [Arundinibacter roseus]